MRAIKIATNIINESVSDFAAVGKAVKNGYKNGRIVSNSNRAGLITTTKNVGSNIATEVKQLDSIQGIEKYSETIFKGIKIAKRTSNVYSMGKSDAAKCYLEEIGRSLSKIKKTSTSDDLPAVFGALGMFIPYPGANAIAMAIGKVAQIVIKSVKNS